MKARRLDDLEVFGDSRRLVGQVYRLTTSTLLRKDFLLCDQLRKSAISILSNIAEGFERDGDREFQQFLSQAKGSAGELRAQLYVALDLEVLPAGESTATLDSVLRLSRRLSALMSYLKNSDLVGRKHHRGRLGP
jgi:four helix bundle protein